MSYRRWNDAVCLLRAFCSLYCWVKRDCKMKPGKMFWIYKSSQRRCSVKKSVLKNFAKFKRTHLYHSKESQACNFIKKDTLSQVLSCEFCKIFKNTFFTEHLWITASDFNLVTISEKKINFSCHNVIKHGYLLVQFQQEMLHILTIAERQIKHVCNRNLTLS